MTSYGGQCVGKVVLFPFIENPPGLVFEKSADIFIIPRYLKKARILCGGGLRGFDRLLLELYSKRMAAVVAWEGLIGTIEVESGDFAAS